MKQLAFTVSAVFLSVLWYIVYRGFTTRLDYTPEVDVWLGGTYFICALIAMSYWSKPK